MKNNLKVSGLSPKNKQSSLREQLNRNSLWIAICLYIAGKGWKRERERDKAQVYINVQENFLKSKRAKKNAL